VGLEVGVALPVALERSTGVVEAPAVELGDDAVLRPVAVDEVPVHHDVRPRPLDPVSPAEWGVEAARAFARGRTVTVAAGAHVFDGLTGLDTCLDATVLKFYDTADAQALDLSCFAGMAPPPFGAAP